MYLCVNTTNEWGRPDDDSMHNDVTGGITLDAMESRFFDFSFLDDDDDENDAIEQSTGSTHDHDFNKSVKVSCCTTSIDDSTNGTRTSTSTSISSTSSDSCCSRSCCDTGTTSQGNSNSQPSSIFTERFGDETTFMPTQPQHSPTCRCTQSSPFSISSTSSSSIPIPIVSNHSWMVNMDDVPSQSSVSDCQWTHPSRQPSITTTIPSLFHSNDKTKSLHDWNETNDEFSWCKEAAARVMISVEAYGKLLMRLRDEQPQQQRPQKPRRRYGKHNHHTRSQPVPPKGWMTHQQIMQQVPKFQRILLKSSNRHVRLQGTLSQQQSSGQNYNHPCHTTPEPCTRNNRITPQQIMNVLQHVRGVRTMTCPYSHNFYYSLDGTWLLYTLNPELGYNPTTGNIVLQLVEQRLLYLLDHSPKEKRGRYGTNEIGPIYEMTFHEPFLFKPLGFHTFKELINVLPSLRRVYDDTQFGLNGIQWYMERASTE